MVKIGDSSHRRMLPLKPLPIVENWDCQSCGLCCRDSIIPLDEEDLTRLRGQHWEEHPDYRGTAVTRRVRFGKVREALAQRDDGRCVFLTDEGLCKIHQVYGFDEKPKMCRQFPLQPVPVRGRILITARRSCPSAARGLGRPISEYFRDLKNVLPKSLERHEPAPPATLNGYSRDWTDTLRVTDALERMMCDARFPLVRRIVHGLEFCDLLSECKPRKLRRMSSADFAELVSVAARSACELASRWFEERQPPVRGTAAAFRQAAAETLRLAPREHSKMTLADRWRMLKAVLAITRGKGTTPAFVPGYSPMNFADLEQPLGALDLDLIRPLDNYFQTLTASLRYCTLTYRHWPIVDGFRAMALQFPIALWAWRWASGGQPDAEKLIPIIGCLDRTHTVEVMTGRRHRRRVSVLAATGQLQRLAVWYAR